MKQEKIHILSLLAALVASVIFGMSFMFSKLALAVAQPSVLLAFRFTLAVAAMTLVIAVNALVGKLRGRKLFAFDLCHKPVGKLVLLGLVQPVAYFIFENYGILYTSSAVAGTIIAAVPVCCILMDVLGAVPMIYRGGKRTVASFAPLAFEAADMGDRQALAIVDNACRELRLLISTCASHLKKAPYLASLLGSLWKAPRLLEGVRDLLSPDYRLLRPDLPPVFGAAVAAAELARVSCGEAFHDRFAESYTTFTKKAEA